MDISIYIKSIIEQDRAPIVICDLDHNVIYMNKSAKKSYGDALLGKSIMTCHNERSCKHIEESFDYFSKSIDNNILFEMYNEKENKDVYIVALRDESGNLIGYYEKHEYRTKETTACYKEPKFNK